MDVSSAQLPHQATVFSFRVHQYRPDSAGVGAEHDGSCRIAFASAGMREHGDVCVVESLLVKWIEDAQSAGVFVVSPVMALWIRQVLLKPGEHRDQPAGVQDLLSPQKVCSQWPGREESLTHLKKGLGRVQHHSPATRTQRFALGLQLYGISSANG